MDNYILQMQHITKLFPGVKALDDVCLDVEQNEIHALVGENGAGKSTLMKILSGVYPHGTYDGEILVDGKAQSFQHIKESEAVGIAIIHQELGLVRSMTVCENIFLGNEIKDRGFINWDAQYKRCHELFAMLDLQVNPTAIVNNLGIGQQQLLEIAKAINKNVRILVLDEPTAPLPEKDSENLLKLLLKLKSDGITSIFISHKLNEVLDIADTITILRDGKTVVTKPKTEFTEMSLVANMVGRDLTDRFEPRTNDIGKTILKVDNWSAVDPDTKKQLLKDVNIDVHAGEVVGISGMIGAGRTELALSLFGALKANITGTYYLDGQEMQKVRHPKEAIEKGIYYLSEDRKKYGLVLSSSVEYNTTLASLHKFTEAGGIINKDRELAKVKEYVDTLKIKTPSVLRPVKNLSGGNQQKVCIAKALLTEPRVMILDEATRGIDVGAKYEIYQLINKLAEQGIAIIMISSEMPEILGLSDRIYVMREGAVCAEFDNKTRTVTQEQIAYSATGGGLS